jgi:hypothetical protein
MDYARWACWLLFFLGQARWYLAARRWSKLKGLHRCSPFNWFAVATNIAANVAITCPVSARVRRRRCRCWRLLVPGWLLRHCLDWPVADP